MGRGPQHGMAGGGFTLIEMIVVLAIIAAIAGAAYAAFMPLYARVQAAYERTDLERQLLLLPQRVRLSGHGGILTGRSGDDLPEGTILAVEGVPEAEGAAENWQVLRLALPAGWRLVVDKPIFYHFSGSCEGGEVVFARAPVTLRYMLTPPLCRPVASDAEPER